jgi:hypothetical protein
VPHRLAPRAFLFAYDASWKKHSSFVSALKKALMKVPEAHIHGVVVLAKEWFVYQVAYAENEPKLKHYTDNGLLRFVKHMIHSLASVPIRQMSIDRYFNVEAASNAPLQPAPRKRRS